MPSSRSSADPVEMGEWVGRVLVNADGARLAQFIGIVTATEQSYSERPTPGGGEHVPDAVSDDDCGLDRATQTFACGEKEIRLRLRVFHLIARHYRYRGGIDT